MFTGIVEEVGTVRQSIRNRLTIEAKTILDGTKNGDSISVNGACLTVVDLNKTGFAVETMPETRKLTNIGDLKVGNKVNLERAISSQGRFGGHFVQGHVDSIGHIISLISEGEAVVAGIDAPAEVLKYIVKKGFVAVNGVSLTIVESNDRQFSVSLVAYTRKNTNLGTIKTGDTVNLEVDIMAKYIEKFYGSGKQEGIISLLNKYDYLKARET